MGIGKCDSRQIADGVRVKKADYCVGHIATGPGIWPVTYGWLGLIVTNAQDRQPGLGRLRADQWGVLAESQPALHGDGDLGGGVVLGRAIRRSRSDVVDRRRGGDGRPSARGSGDGDYQYLRLRLEWQYDRAA